MRRGQITFDFMIAFVLILITVTGIISVASGERANAETFDTAAKLKVFAVDLRDTVAKVYSIGPGYTVVKRVPLKLESGESINVTLNSTSGRVEVVAAVGGKTLRVYQRLPVPIHSTSSVTLGPGDSTFNVTAGESGGRINVELKK
ncbi:hypothetical protein A3L09_08590 [Thermococcus profundus]|uniref:Uncharacterized protein n=1 Tax=Thermococcus profundus TaxID=49899 RepID=A0A2Z2MCT1_THEPR|nr:hypothetical protein [Thermococcus profundus]ASJ03309.1 hypothetical protein A3L09_08590 [Thermococcus profundus]